MMLETSFYNRDACKVAADLLGKVIRHRYKGLWLSAQIIETEAYYINEKGSHSSLGETPKRKAMFMPAGTIYMYYARGQDSLNISVKGKGNAVLLKSAYPVADNLTTATGIKTMQRLNPYKNNSLRTNHKLCAGQTLLCKALNIKLVDWDQRQFNPQQFYIDDTGYQPEQIIQTTRLGIPTGRDEHKLYRFIDHAYARHCTSNPLTKRIKPEMVLINKKGQQHEYS